VSPNDPDETKGVSLGLILGTIVMIGVLGLTLVYLHL
jgi:hypothetical protein